MEVFIEQIQKQVKKHKIMLSGKQEKQFYQYMLLLLEWNRKMNLTAITKQEDIILKHFIDCMTVLPYLEQKTKIIDIGTGAGFPGIPIKIMKENTKVTLVDSLKKRIEFLKEVIQKLDLERITPIHTRAEELGKVQEERESYDVAISRAVAKLNVLLEYLLPFVKVGGICICMKANNIDQELEEAREAIEILGGEIEKIENIPLGGSSIIRKLILIKKVKPTPNNFPRKAGIPIKKPIV